MKKMRFLVFFLFAGVLAVQPAGAKCADLAGKWYPISPSELKKEIKGYFERADVPKLDGQPIAFIAPHAGLAPSGPVAAYTYKAASQKKVDTVVVVGFSHSVPYSDIAVFGEDIFTTPLGDVKIDGDLSRRIISFNPEVIREYPAAFDGAGGRGENSIEMQLPFIQTALKDTKVVLIAMGDQSYEHAEILAGALYESLKTKKDCVIIASTDLCHYLPYDEAVKTDVSTIGALKKIDPESFYDKSEAAQHRLMCGYGAVTAVMMAAKKLGADELVVLKSANSGDTMGSTGGGVVGYLAAAFVKKEYGEHLPACGLPVCDSQSGSQAGSTENRGERSGMLSSDQRKELLKIARSSIENYLKTGKYLEIKTDDALLNEEMGAFVTLHERGELRGCIGSMIGTKPLCLTVRDMAVAAATEDPRFPAVSASEMKDIDIEISALSPMQKIDDPKKIELGKHGVMVRRGFASGVFLPQVATETGWTLDEFMSNLCAHKAGLLPDAWKSGGCDIYVFTAEVFGEKE